MNAMEQQPVDAQQQYPQPMIDTPNPMGPSQDFFWFRLQSDDILDELEHQLKGEVWVRNKDDPKKGSWTPKHGQQLSDEGINDILSLVYSCGINKSVILGCLTAEQINNRCNLLWKQMASYAITNGHNVGITKKNRNILILKIIYLIHSGLSRSEGGRESDQLSTATQRLEHTLREDKPKQQSPILSYLNPLSKR